MNQQRPDDDEQSSLPPCPACGTPLSPYVQKCPRCGRSTHKHATRDMARRRLLFQQIGLMALAVVVFGVIMLVMWLFGFGQGSKGTKVRD